MISTQPRRGDLWAAALDRIARRVSLDDIDPDNPPIREPTRVPEDPIDDQEVRKPDHTTQYETVSLVFLSLNTDHRGRSQANPPEPSIGGTSSPGDKFASSGTSVPAFGCYTAKSAVDDTVTSDFTSALSHGKPSKGVSCVPSRAMETAHFVLRSASLETSKRRSATVAVSATMSRPAT